MINRKNVITLSQFIAEEQLKYPSSLGNLSKIFRDIKLAAKIVNRDVRKAGLVDILGEQNHLCAKVQPRVCLFFHHFQENKSQTLKVLKLHDQFV